jgi:hypothetical protein
MTGNTSSDNSKMIHFDHRKGCGTGMTAVTILAIQITMDHVILWRHSGPPHPVTGRTGLTGKG